MDPVTVVLCLNTAIIANGLVRAARQRERNVRVRAELKFTCSTAMTMPFPYATA